MAAERWFLARVRAGCRVTIPKEIVDLLRLEEGMLVEIAVKPAVRSENSPRLFDGDAEVGSGGKGS